MLSWTIFFGNTLYFVDIVLNPFLIYQTTTVNQKPQVALGVFYSFEGVQRDEKNVNMY